MARSINSNNSLTCHFARNIRKHAGSVEAVKLNTVTTDSSYSVFAALGRISTALEGSRALLSKKIEADCVNLERVAEAYSESDRLTAGNIMSQI